MIIFRPHRGTLSEALGEAMEFRDENEMFEWIEFQWGSFDGFLSKEDLSIGENSGDDKRIGWKNVHYVCTKRFGETDYVKKYGYPQCIGYCSYDYKPMKG